MADIHLTNYNEVYVKVNAEQSVLYELSDKFTFKVPGFQFSPKYRAGWWNGNISLFNKKERIIYKGLLHEIKDFAEHRQYELDIDPNVKLSTEMSLNELELFISKLNIPKKYELRDYQLKYILHCIRNRRALCLSPTSSGKSLIIYILCRYYLSHKSKVLLIVPTLNLLHQMYSDFDDYGFITEKFAHLVCGGREKTSNKPITIATWQTVVKQDKKWLSDYNAVLIDEAHGAKSTSFKKILEGMPNCENRIGFTGTLDGTQTHKFVIEGLLGETVQYITTKDLIDQEYASKLNLKVLRLIYSEEEKKNARKFNYQDELAFIYGSVKRNNLIKNLALSLKGNTLVMFHRISTHGIPLHELIKSEAKIPVYYVAGSVDSEEREEIRKIVETHKDSIIIASSGVFSTGTNIPSLKNIISTNPTKSQIKLLQTIGRGLRKTKTKDSVTFFDIVDDLSHKKRINYTLKHYMERIKIYKQQQFNKKVYNVELK